MTYVKIGGNTYPAEISSKVSDYDWDGRPSKTMRLEMTWAQAVELFVDDAQWSVIVDGPDVPEQEYDNSDYCIAGDITDHRNGYISATMGKITDAELLAIITGGAVE